MPSKRPDIVFLIPRFFVTTGLLAVLMFVATGCVKNAENAGYMTEFSKFEEVREGDSQETVLRLMGSPSSKTKFGNETWYYIGMTLENRAWYAPEVSDQRILIVSFDENGNVKKTGEKGREDMRQIAISEEETPTEGHSTGVLEQLLGNLGRFNNPDGGVGGTPRDRL